MPILTFISGFFTFFSQVKWLIQTLQSTPAEQQQALIVSMQSEAENMKKTGRPTWG